jgi:hypothetical protein
MACHGSGSLPTQLCLGQQANRVNVGSLRTVPREHSAGYVSKKLGQTPTCLRMVSSIQSGTIDPDTPVHRVEANT